MAHTRRSVPDPRLGCLVALAVAVVGCSSESHGAARLQAVSIGSGRLHVAVGITQQLTLTGLYSDGSTAPLATGVTWRSSDATVATVTATGVVVPNARGVAQITATHEASGLSATADLTSVVVIALSASVALPTTGTVDKTLTVYHVLGLTPGVFYTPAVSHMSDDVDLFAYSSGSMEPDTKLCGSELIRLSADSCVAPANEFGELWVAVDGRYTSAGATFTLDVTAARPQALAGTLAYPGDLPHADSIPAAKRMYRITGLTPAIAYEVRVSSLTADVDIEVFADDYKYRSLCESYLTGTADDACTAAAGPAGELYVEIDGETSTGGGSYTLSVAAR